MSACSPAGGTVRPAKVQRAIFRILCRRHRDVETLPWLAPGGDFVLVASPTPRKALWVPNGPRHLRRADAIELFAPFELRRDDETTYDVPLPMGPMRAGVYWFTRPPAG